ncbi:MAG: hydroxyacylglutathione hydrolase [Bdellovibrionaceae bacterium]|nr:hydroxyacylglutathione hydrolase [Pseudobdellovibrionaceae bacterium]
MLKVYLVPILNDNYVHVIVNTTSRDCAIVDPGVAAPVREFMRREGLTPRALLLTHHHDDHIGGASELRREFGLVTYAPFMEMDSIDFADVYLQEPEHFEVLGTQMQVLQLRGHTRGHIGYFAPSEKWLFSGDVLFSMGCGRVFEGTMDQHYQSLQKIKSLPADTKIFCAHEYTENNLNFFKASGQPASVAVDTYALRVRDLRRQNQFTVPFPLSQELEMNPFLRAESLEEFTKLRLLRNTF